MKVKQTELKQIKNEDGSYSLDFVDLGEIELPEPTRFQKFMFRVFTRLFRAIIR